MTDNETCQVCGREDHAADQCTDVRLRRRPRKGAREAGRGMPRGPGPAGWAYRLLLDYAEEKEQDRKRTLDTS